jgi:hypothetical protein
VTAALLAALAGGASGAASQADTAGSFSVSATATPTEMALGQSVQVTGRAMEGAQPAAGVALALEAAPFPYDAYAVLARSTAAANGSFAFAGVSPDENTRLRVAAGAPGSSPPVEVVVDPRVALASRSLGPGRVRLSARIAHLPYAGRPAIVARWYVAARGSDTYHLAAGSETHELPGNVTYASTILNPPAKRFSYRVCLNPPWEAAMGPAGAHGACPRAGFRLRSGRSARRGPAGRARAALEFGGEGRGTPLASFPSAAALAAARSYLASRAGRTSFAVLDSAGQLSGWNTREHFQTASVVKVMFLTAYLQMLQARNHTLGAADRALLYPMIHESNNNDASAVLAAVGPAAVARVAREAGMRDYAPGVGWWAFTQTSAADQVRFLSQLGRLIPSRFYGYARYLMSTIEPEQSWGFPPVARPRWQVYFKTGALPSEGLFNEVALLERGPLRFTAAVFTDGEPSQGYGEETIAGVASRLLAGTP